MEYVSFLAGEQWTDMPTCTDPMIARVAQMVNDRMDDDDRHLLVPLIPRLMGTSGLTVDERLDFYMQVLSNSGMSDGEEAVMRAWVDGVNLLGSYYPHGRLSGMLYMLRRSADGDTRERRLKSITAAMSNIYWCIFPYGSALGPQPRIDWLTMVLDEYDEVAERTVIPEVALVPITA